MSYERKIVSQRIEYLRKEQLHMEQGQFAVALGMEPKKGRSTVNNWERGDIQIKSDDLEKICRTFHVSADWLLGIRELGNMTDDREYAQLSAETGLSNKSIFVLKYLNDSLSSDERSAVLKSQFEELGDDPLKFYAEYGGTTDGSRFNHKAISFMNRVLESIAPKAVLDPEGLVKAIPNIFIDAENYVTAIGKVRGHIADSSSEIITITMEDSDVPVIDAVAVLYRAAIKEQIMFYLDKYSDAQQRERK